MERGYCTNCKTPVLYLETHAHIQFGGVPPPPATRGSINTRRTPGRRSTPTAQRFWTNPRRQRRGQAGARRARGPERTDLLQTASDAGPQLLQHGRGPQGQGLGFGQRYGQVEVLVQFGPTSSSPVPPSPLGPPEDCTLVPCCHTIAPGFARRLYRVHPRRPRQRLITTWSPSSTPAAASPSRLWIALGPTRNSRGVAFAPTAVPEPPSVILGGLAIVALGCYWWRRKMTALVAC